MWASAQNLGYERLNRERLVTLFKHKYHCTATFVPQSVSSEYIRVQGGDTLQPSSKMIFAIFLLTSVSIFSFVRGDCEWTFCFTQVCDTAAVQGDCLCGWSNSTTLSLIDACLVGQCPVLSAATSQQNLAGTCCGKTLLEMIELMLRCLAFRWEGDRGP